MYMLTDSVHFSYLLRAQKVYLFPQASFYCQHLQYRLSDSENLQFVRATNREKRTELKLTLPMVMAMSSISIELLNPIRTSILIP